ncbi:uncharacterized protein LOC126662142 [Mercurialis annua]|uniref:uncharacterized protein LOC126662142 n=1 Tax=Mercurialis annua TaxID=3986 RepID=UPI00215E803A|nr:uncharacterized protein LOC126662142 [Mercurialis annua]
MDEPEILRINIEEEEEFYETIEAPKFVDLAAPEPDRHGDDRYWFCSRVGCDQKHEEEMDSEEIYKNFVLRVMAARSPNIRLRRALYRKDSWTTGLKCPRTVPAKLSKSRIPRLALISSISKRIGDPKVKVKPISKQNLTPNTKKNEQQLSVTTTTSKTKKQLSNSDVFRSVRNPKTTASAVPKNRVVAKTLVFSSPKKLGKTKSSLESKTPSKTLCAEMKKLEITSLKKQVLGCNNKPLPSDNCRKQLRGREVKSRVFDGILTQNHKKIIKEKKLQQNHDVETHERVENDFINTDIEEKVGNGTKRDDGNSLEEHIAVTETSKSSSDENGKEASSDGDDPKIQASEEITERNNNQDAIISDDKENISEVMENDDKENASASNENRKLGSKTNGTEDKIPGKNETLKGNIKTVKAKIKQSIESSTAAAQVLQLKKFKPTNPKPFRLRTDERGILKEANVEKKISSAFLGEVASVPRMVAGGNSLKRRQNVLQRNDKFLERNENRNDANENGEKEMTDQLQNKISESKIMKERVRRKPPSTTPMRHTVSSQQKLVASQQECRQGKSALKPGVSSKGTKPPSMQRLARTREAASSKTTCITQLGTIIENSLAVLGTKEEAAKPSEGGDSTTCPVSNHSLQGKRLNTIPKEPNFHAIHTPKSCTRRVAQV